MWDKIVNNLAKQLSKPRYESWIRPIKFLENGENSITVAVHDDYSKNWIEKNYSKKIKTAIFEETGKNLELIIKIDASLSKEINSESQQMKPETQERVSSSSVYTERQIDFLKRVHQNLNLKYTFDTFVVGPNNKFAYAIAKSVADNPGKNHNPFFIYGGVGLGKTHLMQAIGHHVYNKFNQKKIKYCTTETFTNDLIESLRRKTTSDFRLKYRQIDLLLIDDIQFLEGKETTQEEFFNTFNTLHEAGKQIVMSSDRPPKSISNLTERLVSRFEWGIAVDIQVPDLETRIAILKNKANTDKMDVPDDVIELIAASYQNNIRELEGALNRVIAYISVTGAPMNVESVRSLIESTSKTKTLTPDKIIDLVAEHFKISSADIKGSTRMKEIAQARQIAIYLTREITQLSFPAIGDSFGKKHSTIIYAYDKMKEELGTNPSLAVLISDLKSKIT